MIDPKRYPAEVFFSDEDEGYIALARDLPGCSAFGETQVEALAELQHAIEAWQLAAQTAGNPIPEPSKPTADPLPSGKILLRTPRSLHAALIEAAKRESVSLNHHLVSVLSASTASTSLLAMYSDRLTEMVWNIPVVTRVVTNMVVEPSLMRRFHVSAPVGQLTHLDYTQTGKTLAMIDVPKILVATTSEQTRKHAHG